MTPPPLSAACHCGEVRVEADRYPSTVTSCNCSICRRYGALWAYYPRASARVAAGAGSLTRYVWGDRTIAFCHCRACGSVTHWESIEDQPDARVAINARLLPIELVTGLRVRQFDGAESWRYLDE